APAWAAAMFPAHVSKVYIEPRFQAALILVTTHSSAGLAAVSEPPFFQQRLNRGIAPPEGAIGLFGLHRTARRVNVPIKPFRHHGIENIARFLKRAKGIGLHDLSPEIGIIARGIPAPCKNMLEMRGPVPERYRVGHADAAPQPLFERGSIVT